MRKRLVVLVVFIIAATILIKQKGWYGNLSLQPNYNQTQVLGENKTTDSKNAKSEDITYSYILEEIDNNDHLILINNLKDKKTSDEIMAEYNCSILINGGYYTQDYTHLGLFISDYKKISSYRKNSILNGFVSINDFSVARITKDVPLGNLNIALQAGPIIKENGSYSTTLWNEKTGRRVLALTTGDNRLYYLVLYNKTSVFEGPTLNEIQNNIKEIEAKEKIEFADIINLDGGAASVFISDKISLKELSTVGSFFCLQNRF